MTTPSSHTLHRSPLTLARRIGALLVTLAALGACAEEGAPPSSQAPLQTVRQAVGEGIVIDDGDGVTASETGANDTYTVKLSQDPGASTVTITLTADEQLLLTNTTSMPAEGPAGTLNLSFDTANWDIGYNILVDAFDDDVDEASPHTGTIDHDSSSTDAAWNELTAMVNVDITDDDTAGFDIVQTGGNTTVSEDNGTDTYTVVLTSQPTHDVVLALSTSSDFTRSPAQLTFTPDNWASTQMVTVTAVADDLDEGTEGIALNHVITTADTSYDALSDPVVTVTVTDNDTAGVTVTPTGGNTAVTEAGGTDTYSIVLNSQPTATVTLTINDGAQLNVSSETRTFTTANWDTPQSITVSAEDDPDIEGNHSAMITHTAASADPKYQGISISNLSVSITDNDAAGLAIVRTAGNNSVNEMGATSDSFTLALTARPTNNVTVALAAPGGQVNVSPTSRIFTSANWSTPQTVTLTAIDDMVDEASPHTDQITFTVTSSDGDFNGLAVIPEPVSITDNDSADIILTQSGGNNVTEGGNTDTVSVRLATQPTANVTVTFVPASPDQVGVSPASLVFGPGDWNTDKNVTLTALDDTDAEGAHTTTVVTTVTSTDGNYNNFNLADLTVNITDNDSVGIVLSATSGQVTEASGAGRTTTFQVRLNSRPSQNVTINLSSADTSEGTVSPASLTFSKNTMSNRWDINQTITITGVDDALDDGDIDYNITLVSSSSDSTYNNLSRTINMTTVDNDAAGITVNPTSGLSVTEASGNGRTATFNIRLGSQPTANVTIPLSSTNTAKGTVSPASALLTSANWMAGVTVTITGVDNMIDDGDIGYMITTGVATSSDSNYSGTNPPDVSVTTIDNDVPSFSVGAPAAVSEGDSGSPQLAFPVTLSLPSTSALTVRYSTENMTATSGSDYAAVTNQTLTFSAGETSTVALVTILPDNVTEVDETVRVRLNTPTGGATINTATANGTILNDDATPVATPRNLAATEDMNATGSVAGTDTDDGPGGLTFARVTNASKGSVTINSNGSFTYVPNADANGADSFTFTASDGANTSAPATVSVTIMPVNDAPRGVTAGGPYTVNEGSSVQLTGNGNDTADNNTNLTYTWDFDGDGQFDDATGRQPSYPGSDGPATITVRVNVSDGQLSAQANATVNVVNIAPDVTALGANPSMGVVEGDAVAFTAAASDPGDPVLAYTWSYGDSATDQGSNLSQVSHSFGDEGAYTVRVTVDDSDGGMDTMTRTVNVANASPTFLTPAPTQAGEGQLYRYEIAMRDPGVTDTLTWTLIDGPTGMTISPTTPCTGAVTDLSRCRVLTWTPTSEQVTGIESQHVVLRVTDNDSGRADREWDITLDFMDTDNGGAPDSCETASNYNPNDPADDTSDTDMDGRSLIIECQLGTDPRVSDAPGAPSILSPRGFAVVGGDVQLNITDAVAINDRTYAFEGIDVSTGEAIFSVEGLTGSDSSGVVSVTATIPGASLTENGRYLWRARSFDGYTFGPWSETDNPAAPDSAVGAFIYSNLDEAPPAPVLLTPRGVTSSRTPSFELSNVEDPEGSLVKYDFELLSDEGAVVIASVVELAQGAGAMTRWSPGQQLEENRLYRWRARANDVRGSLDGSGPWSDFVEVLVDSENTVPTAPLLLYPGADQLITQAAEVFIVASGIGIDPDSEAITYTVRMGLREDLADAVEVAGLTPDLPPLALPGDTGEFGAELDAFTGLTLPEDATVYVEVFGSDGQANSTSARGRFRFSATNASPSTPTLMAPIGAQTVPTVAPTLTWLNATDPEGEPLRYDIDLTTDASFADVAWELRGLTANGATTSTLEAPPLQSPQLYTWRIRAVDPQGATSPWSDPETFFVSLDNLPPTPPVLQAPADGASFLPGDAIVLSWAQSVDPEGEAITYQITVDDAAGNRAFADDLTEQTSVDVGVLPPGGYVWSVRASDSVVTSVPSARWRFTLSAPIPEIPTPEEPDDDDEAPRYPEPIGESCACAAPPARPGSAAGLTLGALLLGAALLNRRRR